MNNHDSIERRILESAGAGRMPEELRGHLAECATCRETATVTGFMMKLAGIEKDAPLPNAGIVWLKAQLLQNRQIQDQASQAISQVQRTTWIVIVGCWAAVLAWKWEMVSSWMNDASLSRLIMSSISGNDGISLPFVLALLGLMTATALFAVHSMLADE